MTAKGGCRLMTVLLLLLLAPLAVATGPDVEALFASFARHQQLQADFEEIRTSGMLAIPMKSEGRLLFRAPAYLEKRIDRPFQEIQIIDGDRLQLQRIGRDPQPREISLGSVPELELIVNAMRYTLAGDLSYLRGLYEIRASGTRKLWRLRLQPRDASVAMRFEFVEISGSGERIHEFRVVQDENTETRTLIRADD